MGHKSLDEEKVPPYSCQRDPTAGSNLDLHDVHGSIGKAVRRTNLQACCNLLRGWSRIMYDVASLRSDGIGAEVGQSGYIWVTRRTMVAFIVIVGQNLPVVVSLHFPNVIEFVFIEVELLTPCLRVNAFKFVLPGYLWLLLAIKVDPDEALIVDVDMNGKQTIFALVKMVQLLISGSLSKRPIQPIRPSMVLAGKYS